MPTQGDFSKSQKFEYHILPGHFSPGFIATDQYNQVFRYWTSFWDEVMRENGTTERIDPYDFLRSDFVTAIKSGEQIVAVHLYSILNFQQENIDAHPYFKGESELRFLEELRRAGVRSAMTLEFLTVNRGFRKSKVGFSFAPVVVGLGYEIQKALDIDSTLGRCRQDNGVNRLMTDVGGETVLEGVMMYNTPTDFCHVSLQKMQPHPDISIRDRVQELWNTRHDWTGLTETKTIPVKIGA